MTSAPPRLLAALAAAVIVASSMVPSAGSDGFVLVGAGDIADCSHDRDEQTAALMDTIEGTVFTAGDNAYTDGTPQEYTECYHPTWGRHRARTRPSPGNHERDGTGYRQYFDGILPAEHPFWYSYDLGSWHVISLDSYCGHRGVECRPDSAQVQWLRADLAATDKTCIAAYWHHPRFSSGAHGSSNDSEEFWAALYDAGADVVINGHEHSYERFAKQNPQQLADPNGIRQFIVGTGGASQRSFRTPEPHSEVRLTETYGVIKLTLLHGSYTWELLTTDGTVADSGSDACNGEVPGLPDTTISSGPPARSTSTDATFTFDSSIAGSSFECALDGNAWHACSSPATYQGVGLGEHMFHVRARHGAAVDPSPASWFWRIDPPGEHPETTITRGPHRTTIESYATFTFTSSVELSTFECRLDAGAWQTCSSPHNVSGLSAGEHTFEVRATDPGGTTDPTPASWSWAVQPDLESLIAELQCVLARLTDPDPPACII